MKFLLLSICVFAVHCLVCPPQCPTRHTPPVLRMRDDDQCEDIPTLLPIQAEAARTLMASWALIMLTREGMYPQCSYDSCYDGIQTIGHRDSLTTPTDPFLVFSYNHVDVLHNEFVTSHVVMCVMNTKEKVLYAHGIVENPDNVDYEKSIIPMIEELQVKALASNYTVSIDPLMKWAHGVYHYALTHQM